MQSQRSSALPMFRRVALPSMFLLLMLTTAGTLSAQSEQTPATATPSGQQAPPPQPAAPPAMSDAQSSSSSDVQTARVLQPKDHYKYDVALSGFAQLTQYINGNSQRSDTTTSGGGLVSFRQSPRWWFGYEADYGFTKYTDAYGFGVYRIKHNTNEVTLAYLVDRNVYKGLHAFGSIGTGAIFFSPTTYGGSVALIVGTPTTQSLPVLTYSIGVEKLVTSRFGIRVQYRADTYKDPNFKFEALNTHKLRETQEPAAGVYYRF